MDAAAVRGLLAASLDPDTDNRRRAELQLKQVSYLSDFALVVADNALLSWTGGLRSRDSWDSVLRSFGHCRLKGSRGRTCCFSHPATTAPAPPYGPRSWEPCALTRTV